MNEIPGSLVSALDQMANVIRDVTVIMGSYYKSLLENGIPEELAYQLTLQYAEMFWAKNLGMNG